MIRRCLDSVRPIIDHWVIVDTGSTDGTQDIIREHLRDLPGELHERPWRDFAHNRSEALELARGKSDYTLIIDADDTLEISPEYDPSRAERRLLHVRYRQRRHRVSAPAIGPQRTAVALRRRAARISHL